MRKIVNVMTGEVTIDEDFVAPVFAAPPPTEQRSSPSAEQIKSALIGVGFTEEQVSALLAVAAKIKL
jgi:hypothetical protein